MELRHDLPVTSTGTLAETGEAPTEQGQPQGYTAKTSPRESNKHLQKSKFNPDTTGVSDSLLEMSNTEDALAPLSPTVENSEAIASPKQVAYRPHNRTTSVENSETIASPRQVAYRPHSRATSVNTLLPYNMQTATDQALTRLEQRVGSLDTFVADRLNYNSLNSLHRYFSAEQIDALALAIHNLEEDSGFIIGDQTGVGKGRIVAGMMRYAKFIGKTPIFITKDATLYADMMRDVQDIGMTHFNPFVTNSSLSLPLPDGRKISTLPQTHKTEMAALQQSQSLGHYDAIFTLYSQLQTVKGQETPRRAFLRTFIPNSILILDESHEAGGDGQANTKGAANRAEFVRELVDLAGGVVYSSATYAKRPNVMGLYRKTDMRLAVDSLASLESLIERGGVPLQQAVATMLSDAGQYIRRERSFEGVEFSPDVVSVDQDTANNIAVMMSKILEFDRFKQQAVKSIDKDLKAEAKALLGDNSTGQAGASSTNFTSIMHNLIDQMLLALKAEACVQKALTLLRQDTPEKPVIALSNTMGSLIQHFATQEDLKPDDALDIDFGDLLLRYLERSRDIIIGDPYGKKERHRLSDAELGNNGVIEYQAVRDLIKSTNFSNIPVSPIDYLIHRLNQEGYRVGEITGREHILAYHRSQEGVWTTTYQKRSGKDRSKANAVKQVNAFNQGQLDILILNRSGSTGISLHASEKFRDQKRRHMIILQPDRDINQFMQMLGRVHRTGQVIPPNFTLLMSDIPAEKRPGAVLARKMASLNANTTAARSNGLSLDVPDFMNVYGSKVAIELMVSQPDLHYRLGEPLNNIEDRFDNIRAIEKITGRIPLLPLEDQENLYRLIEDNYQEFVAEQEALGVSILEAKTLDLDAHVISEVEVIPPDPAHNSPFTDSVTLQVVNAKTPRKPFTQLQVVNSVRQALDLSPLSSLDDYQPQDLTQQAKTHAQSQLRRIEHQLDTYRRQHLHQQKSLTALDSFNDRLNEQYTTLKNCFTLYPLGTAVEVKTDQGFVYNGVVGNIYSNPDPKGSPAAPSNWKINLLLADPIRELTLPLSRLNTDKEGAMQVTAQDAMAIYDSFDEKQSINREIRQIFTGNLLRAYEKFQTRGNLVNYTDRQGNIRQGLLTPKDFDLEKTLENQPVSMPTVAAARRFLEEIGLLMTADQMLAIKPHTQGDYVLQTPKAKDTGGRYYLDADILEAADDEFYSISDRMECHIPKERLNQVLSTLMMDKGYTLASFDHQEQARKLLGVALPTLTLPHSQDLEAMLPPVLLPPQQDREDYAVQPIEPESQITINTDNQQIRKPDEPLTSQTPETRSISENVQKPEPSQVTHQDKPPHSSISSPILRSQEQKGKAARNVVRLLEQSGLLDALAQNEDFHAQIPNDPYIPLVIERHEEWVYFTHYLTENGDMFIDSEMVFRLDAQGCFSLHETACHSMGGEYRACDNSYACMFSQNLLHQGFANAARHQALSSTSPATQDAITNPKEAEGAIKTHREYNNDNQPKNEPKPEKVTETTREREDVLSPAKPLTFTSIKGEQLKLCLISDNKAPPVPPAPEKPQPTIFDPTPPAPSLKQPEAPQNIPQTDRNTPPKPDNHKPSKPDNSSLKEPVSQKERKPDNYKVSKPDNPSVKEPVSQKERKPDNQKPASSQRYNPKTDPDLQQLRSWYRAAQILGESEQFLQNIHRLARYVRQKHAAQKPVEISSVTQKRINRDLKRLQDYRHCAKAIVSASQVILQQQGTTKDSGVRVFKGKSYGIYHQDNNFGIYRLGGEKPQPIVRITEGALKVATFNQRDVKAFQAYAQYVQEQAMGRGG